MPMTMWVNPPMEFWCWHSGGLFPPFARSRGPPVMRQPLERCRAGCGSLGRGRGWRSGPVRWRRRARGGRASRTRVARPRPRRRNHQGRLVLGYCVWRLRTVESRLFSLVRLARVPGVSGAWTSAFGTAAGGHLGLFGWRLKCSVFWAEEGHATRSQHVWGGSFDLCAQVEYEFSLDALKPFLVSSLKC